MIERITFNDGAWWEFHDYLTHKAALAVKILMRDALTVGDKVELDMTRLNAQAMDDAMIVASTTNWSYGPVSVEVLGLMPEAQYVQVLGRMNRLYGELPLVESAGKPSGKPSRWRTLLRKLFRWS